MGWHDACIYGFATQIDEQEPWKNELIFDLDYIFKWVQPELPASNFTFWTAPCTLIFENCHDLVIDIDSLDIHLEVAGINLLGEIENEHNKSREYDWQIELQTGHISFKSEGLKQIVRKQPSHIEGQLLGLKDRGGISFDKTPCK